MANRSSDYVTEVRNDVRQLWAAINSLVAHQREWTALDYGTTLETADSGENAGITASEVGAAVFDTANALVALLNQGHATNLAKLL